MTPFTPEELVKLTVLRARRRSPESHVLEKVEHEGVVYTLWRIELDDDGALWAVYHADQACEAA